MPRRKVGLQPCGRCRHRRAGLGVVGVGQGAVKADGMKFFRAAEGWVRSSPASSRWISTGSAPTFLDPSVSLLAGAVEKHQLAAARRRAYYRWLDDYCRPYPDRLFAVGMSLSRSSATAAWISAAICEIRATFAAGQRSKVAPISLANIISAASIAAAARSVAVFTARTLSMRNVESTLAS